jgi:hypothetical protein
LYKIFFHAATATATAKNRNGGTITKKQGKRPASPCKAFLAVGRYIARVKNAAIIGAFPAV